MKTQENLKNLKLKSMRESLLGKNSICFFPLIFLGLFFFGCDYEGKTSKRMLGKTDMEILERYGTPMYDTTFVLSEHLYPYQSRCLLIWYPDYKEKEVLIREISWEKRKKQMIVWFKEIDGKWIVIDNLKWRTDWITY